MSSLSFNHHASIFVSHASEDLARVRQVRNYLEQKGASPLLFHLLALQEPEEFWPLIEREIGARNFFLYCDSEVAATKPWVRREREAVAEVVKRRHVRIGTIHVDGPDLLLDRLDEFLAKTRVFPSFSHDDRAVVQPFLDATEAAGFQVFQDLELAHGQAWKVQIEDELRITAKNGWVVAFLSGASLDSPWVRAEINMAEALGAKFIPVAIEPIHLPPEQMSIQVLDATSDLATAPARLVEIMLARPV